MNRSWLSWTPRPKNGRWMWPSLFLISFLLFYPLLILLFSFLLLDLAKISTYGSPSSYFSLSAPSSLFFFSSDLAQLSPNWPICMYRFVLNFSSPSLHYFICLFFSKILPSSCSPLPTPCLFSSPPSLSFLSLSLSLSFPVSPLCKGVRAPGVSGKIGSVGGTTQSRPDWGRPSNHCENETGKLLTDFTLRGVFQHLLFWKDL